MLAVPLLALLCATPVELHSSAQLSLLPRGELKAHLRAVDAEVRALRHDPTGWMVLQQASERATPFVLVTAAPLGVLGFISAETNARFNAETWLVAGGVVAVGLFVAVFYAVGRVVEHTLFERPANRARLEALTGYRPVVLEAISRAPPPPEPG